MARKFFANYTWHDLVIAPLAALLVAGLASYADAQTTNGKVTTAAPTYVTGNTSPLSLDTAGALRVTSTATANTLANGQATSATPSYTNATPNPLSLDLSGNLRSKDFSTVAQGTALGTTQGGLVMGSVTTAAPTYTTGQISPINMDTAGNQRVNLTTAIPAGANTIGGVNVIAALPAGGNTIGGVNVIAALPTGTNTIGTVVLGPLAGVQTNFTNFPTTATVIKASAGTIVAVTVPPSSVASQISFFDNASACSGTVRLIAVGLTQALGGVTYSVDLPAPITFTTGITACTSAGTIAASVMFQ